MESLLYPFIVLAAGLLSWWSYSGQSVANWKWMLIFLRTGALSIAAVLLLDPSITLFGEQETRKKILLAVDNSSSVAIRKGTYQGAATAQKVLDELNAGLSDKSELKTVFFDQNVRTSGEKQPDFAGGQTNLSDVLERVKQEYDLNAVVLVTDGIATVGKNPSFQIKDISVPVFAVALGDTGLVDDIWIEEVEVPDQVFSETAFSVTVLVGGNGFQDREINVELFDGTNRVASRKVTFQRQNERIPVKFQLSASEKGLKTYTVRTSPQETEFSNTNNASTFSVDVKSGKTRILHVAFEVNPDVKVVREIMEQDPAVSLYAMNMTSLGKWMGAAKTPVKADTFELVIVHGIPNLTQLGTFDPFQGAWKSRPKMVIAGFSSRLDAAQQSEWFPVQFQGYPDWRPVTLHAAGASVNHPVTSGLTADIQKAPAIQGLIRKATVKPGVTVLFTASFLGTDTEAPTALLYQKGSLRSSFLFGYGFSGWYVSPELGNRALLEKLLSQMAQWTAAEPASARSLVRPIKPVFTSSEEVLFDGEVRNESGEPDNNASVSVRIQDSNSGTFSFKRERPGVFSANLGRMQPAVYPYEATIQSGSGSKETFKGQFEVTEQQVETVNLIRNQVFLQEIASSTGGFLSEPGNIAELLAEMEQKGLLKTSITWKERHFLLRTFWYWFALVLLMLSAEWLLRKRLSLP